MVVEVLVFLICMADALYLLVLSVYLIILLSDLECDYLNTKQGCRQLNQIAATIRERINMFKYHFVDVKLGLHQLTIHIFPGLWVLPELVGAAIIPILLLLTWHWFMFILVSPLAGQLIYRYVKLPLGNMGIYDPTDIRNRGMLTYFQKEAFAKIAYNLIIFFISLYGFIVTLIN